MHVSPEWEIGDPNGPGCYPSLLRTWLDATFPLSGGEKHEIVNGAVGGADSSYYAFCAVGPTDLQTPSSPQLMVWRRSQTHHIPKDVDLLILDFDVNDQA